MDRDESCDKVVQLSFLVLDHGGAVDLKVLQWRRGDQRGYFLRPSRDPEGNVDSDGQRRQPI